MPDTRWSPQRNDRVDLTKVCADAPLGREQLEKLFTAGLTSFDIGKLYGLDRSRISQLARKFGLNSRSLRSAGRSLALLRPDLAREFVADTAGRDPARGPRELTLGSGVRATWRCSSCGHMWRTSVANRALRGSGCPLCARARLRTEALQDRARTPAVAFVRPDLAAQFIRNLTVLDRNAKTTPAGSHDRVVWRCPVGHEWTAAARQRVKHRTHCPRCRGGLHRSRLEYEVAELLTAATGLEITVGYEESRTDRACAEKVDLRIDELNLLIDLDPSRWHQLDRAEDRDSRKLRRLEGRRYFRFRPMTIGLLLGALGAPLAGQVSFDIADETDAWVWTMAILPIVSQHTQARHGYVVRSLCPDKRAEALGKASLRWSALNRHEERPSLLSEHPTIAAEFVAVPERTGVTAADLAPAGSDRVLWRCAKCSQEWVTRTSNRTVLRTDCPPCSYRAAGRRAARPRLGESFADRYPGLMKHFIENLTHPGIGPTQLRPNSADLCRWFCPHCGRLWEVAPHALNRRPTGGCRLCCGTRISAGRKEDRPRTSTTSD